MFDLDDSGFISKQEMRKVFEGLESAELVDTIFK